MKPHPFSLIIIAPFLLCSCVDLTTRAPIKVDIDMRLDVYQHTPENKTPPSPEKKAKAGTPELPIEVRRRNRMADVQVMKNSRIVGEGHDGLLFIQEEVPGDYGTYVRDTVRNENADRMEQMKQVSAEQKIPLPEIQKKQAEQWRNRAFKGEWVEVPTENGGYNRVQKDG